MIGVPVFIDRSLEIYVQELESQSLVERISNALTTWHTNRTKYPTKFWYKGDICSAPRNSDGKYHRAEIVRVCQKQRNSLVSKIPMDFYPSNYFNIHKIL